MNITTDDFRRHFELLSDSALLSTNRDDLTEAAQVCYDEEVARRGLNDSPSDADTEDPADTQPGRSSADKASAVNEDTEIAIATFTYGEEANLALGLLQSAAIPARIATQYVAMGPADFHVMIPASFEEHALEVLDFEISEEDLAAQAEAAGIAEEEEFEPGELGEEASGDEDSGETATKKD
jgi:hypothetical protein